ncbi:hypothetical protein Pcinc_010962 [Petrolisthes cinctipes]|uniref:Uncharacterized protein n=1 Tax=Petrolisthes cinctipes TaxID=88211 RepID=A0AAE1G440_PETCI|nr:hypothetical protein Pcinc_010962 [Petrolisthes cinctipes]
MWIPTSPHNSHFWRKTTISPRAPWGNRPVAPAPSHTSPQLTPYYTGPPASSEVLHLLRYFEDTRRQEETERRREDAEKRREEQERRREEQERRREDNERLLTLFTAMSTRHTDVTPQSNVQSVSSPPTPSSGANKGHPRNLNPTLMLRDGIRDLATPHNSATFGNIAAGSQTTRPLERVPATTDENSLRSLVPYSVVLDLA